MTITFSDFDGRLGYKKIARLRNITQHRFGQQTKAYRWKVAGMQQMLDHTRQWSHRMVLIAA
ncbi:MAG: hypothetical protein M3N97_10095 [Pseudomonadota bacterium]|nr:hypothetical protein [Pseudomonadota bacterium]